MQRLIAGWQRVEDGSWIALLDCGHRLPVRSAGGPERTATALECPLCVRAELPEDLELIRSTPIWDETTMPAALRTSHRVAERKWGLLVVDGGQIDFVAPDLDLAEQSSTVAVRPGRPQPIPPGVVHWVKPSGPVHFHIEFFGLPALSLLDPDLQSGE